ncbi:MAG TPA: HisA/HisF-related TIM barrel protein, partial [Bacteroidota bacterium]|nr:HisA/HisF-related TIM barrel protein [Bacteroidota bacterium]
DPIEMAKLWRKENAKCLHVIDVDGAIEGHPVNFEIIERMVKTVDIPIETSGGLRTFEDIKRVFSIGAYRVIIGTMMIDNPDQAKKALDTFSPNKVVLSIDVQNNFVKMMGRKEETGLMPISLALNAKQMGFKRIVYTWTAIDEPMTETHIKDIKVLAEQTRLRVTVHGGIYGLQDLLKLQEIESVGVDSVIIGNALYQNNFSCQALWRICEAGNFPYTAKI